MYLPMSWEFQEAFKGPCCIAERISAKSRQMDWSNRNSPRLNIYDVYDPLLAAALSLQRRNPMEIPWFTTKTRSGLRYPQRASPNLRESPYPPEAANMFLGSWGPFWDLDMNPWNRSWRCMVYIIIYIYIYTQLYINIYTIIYYWLIIVVHHVPKTSHKWSSTYNAPGQGFFQQIHTAISRSVDPHPPNIKHVTLW